MVSGVQPIRAKKAAYYADPRLAARIMPPPDPAALPPREVRSDDWTGLAASADPAEIAAIIRRQEDAANSGLRREPELPDHVAIVKETAPAPPAQEFSIVEDEPEDAARQAAARRRMQGIARQASLDPDDGIEL